MSRPDPKTLALGIDIGGTWIRVAVVDPDGGVVDSCSQSSEAESGPEAVVEGIVGAGRRLLERAAEPVGVAGVGIAGQIDASAGKLLGSPNLGWRGVDLKTPLQDGLDLPVVVANDVSAAAWGEHRFGAGRSVPDLVCVFVGTGVGCGVISGGRLLEGAGTSATELGHVAVIAGGRQCSCRHRGCLEAYVGGWAIAERAQERCREDPDAGRTIVERAGAVSAITAEHVAGAFDRQDPLAGELVQETQRLLAAAAVGMVNTFNPTLLLLGGGVVRGLPALVAGLEESVTEHAFPAFTRDFRVGTAELGDDAGVVGAATLARDEGAGAASG